MKAYQHTGGRFNHWKGLVSTDKMAKSTKRKTKWTKVSTFLLSKDLGCDFYLCLAEIKALINMRHSEMEHMKKKSISCQQKEVKKSSGLMKICPGKDTRSALLLIS